MRHTAVCFVRFSGCAVSAIVSLLHKCVTYLRGGWVYAGVMSMLLILALFITPCFRIVLGLFRFNVGTYPFVLTPGMIPALPRSCCSGMGETGGPRGGGGGAIVLMAPKTVATSPEDGQSRLRSVPSRGRFWSEEEMRRTNPNQSCFESPSPSLTITSTGHRLRGWNGVDCSRSYQ